MNTGKIIAGGDNMKKVLSIVALILVAQLVFSSSASVKQVASDTFKNKTVQLGGEAFGIRMFSDGVMVIEVEECLIGSDLKSPAVNAGIKVKDVIKSVNGKKLSGNEEFTNYIENYQDIPLKLVIERENEVIDTELIPVLDSQGIYRVGMWIKDSAAGIGTVTYYDTDNNTLGALGHGICESGTGKIIPLSYGEIAKAQINDITKSENGKVGSLNGYFSGQTVGNVYENTDVGIFGNITSGPNNKIIEIADKGAVKIGKAEIYCTLKGEEKQSYDIRIKRLSNRGENCMVIEITDPELLELTGGIVQGMSGSPIVQNGKLVGAVTHVLVNNVKCGYGIYIEDMINFAA